MLVWGSLVSIARGGIEQEVVIFLRGDVDGSGTVNISDVIRLNDHLFAGGPAPACPAAGDADADGSLSVADSAFLLSWLFDGGAAPSPLLGCEL